MSVRIIKLHNTWRDVNFVNAIIDDLEVNQLSSEVLVGAVRFHIQNEISTRNRNIKEYSFKDKAFRHAAVNYLRHKQSKYDEVINLIEERTDRVMVQKLKGKILKDIAEKYPFLKKECIEQRLK